MPVFPAQLASPRGTISAAASHRPYAPRGARSCREGDRTRVECWGSPSCLDSRTKEVESEATQRLRKPPNTGFDFLEKPSEK